MSAPQPTAQPKPMRRQQPRAGQNWVFDNFIKLTDNEDVLHPGILGVRLERGFKQPDIERVFSRLSGRRALPREWARVAKQQEALAWRADATLHCRLQPRPKRTQSVSTMHLGMWLRHRLGESREHSRLGAGPGRRDSRLRLQRLPLALRQPALRPGQLLVSCLWMQGAAE